MNSRNTVLIERYVSGLASEQEKKEVESLFMNGDSNNDLRHLLENEWETFEADSKLSDVNLKALLDAVHHTIHNNMIRKQHSPLGRFIRIYSKAAAILLLPLMLAGGLALKFLGNSFSYREDPVTSEIFAPFGSRVSFNLPDGTNGMLNSGSRLSYPLPFNKNRQIRLEGEAWFEVKRDEKHPFKINIGNSEVEVLGTSFNVSAYPEERYIEVVLQEGKVEFVDKITHQRTNLKPAERLVYKDGIVTKTLTDPEKYSGWTAGRLIFRGDPMAEVARRIERWYNVDVELADKEIEKYSYRATFEDDNLEDVFRFLSMTSPITYKISSREMNPDGTYKKQIITIYLKK